MGMWVECVGMWGECVGMWGECLGMWGECIYVGHDDVVLNAHTNKRNCFVGGTASALRS